MDYKYYVPLVDWEMEVITGLLKQVSDSLRTPDATINPQEHSDNILLFDQLLVRFYTVKDYYDNKESEDSTDTSEEPTEEPTEEPS